MESWKNKKQKYYCLISFYVGMIGLMIAHFAVLKNSCLGKLIFNSECREASIGMLTNISWLTLTDYGIVIASALIVGCLGLLVKNDWRCLWVDW